FMALISRLFFNTLRSKANVLFRRLQILSASFMAFSHGANDAQKAMGIITLALLTAGHLQSTEVPHWVIVTCALAMGLGTVAGGWRIVRTLGMLALDRKTETTAMATKVLIVDDEKDLVDLVRYNLEKEGFQCLLASDGLTALRLAREQRPGLLILDLMLPGLDGLEICRQLRRDPMTASLPIIMLTAKAAEVDRVVGLEVGADDYIVKPFSPRELV